MQGFSYVAPSSFDGLPEESGSCQGRQPRPAQIPNRSLNHSLAELIHQLKVTEDNATNSPRFDAHQQATLYPAMSNTQQILPSNKPCNPPVSDAVKESHLQRYARMDQDHTPVAPMFGHRNLVPSPPNFNMVQNPPLIYNNASTRSPIPEPVEVPPPRYLPAGNVIQNMAGVARPTQYQPTHARFHRPTTCSTRRVDEPAKLFPRHGFIAPQRAPHVDVGLMNPHSRGQDAYHRIQNSTTCHAYPELVFHCSDLKLGTY